MIVSSHSVVCGSLNFGFLSSRDSEDVRESGRNRTIIIIIIIIIIGLPGQTCDCVLHPLQRCNGGQRQTAQDSVTVVYSAEYEVTNYLTTLK